MTVFLKNCFVPGRAGRLAAWALFGALCVCRWLRHRPKMLFRMRPRRRHLTHCFSIRR